MKPIYILSTLLILATSCGNSQSTQGQKAITGDIETDLNNLLPRGKTTVDVMDGIMQTKRQEELTIKFQEAIKKKVFPKLGFIVMSYRCLFRLYNC